MSNDIGYLETSALQGTNIEAAFLTIINRKSKQSITFLIQFLFRNI